MTQQQTDDRETTLSSEEVFRGQIIKVFLDRVRLPSGNEGTREVVRHGGAVAVLPVFDDGRVLLVRQFRYALGRYMLEIPAGKLDVADEPPEECAKRELLEETGYVADRWSFLTRYATSAGFTDEWVGIYRAFGLRHEGYDTDPDEGTVCEVVTGDEALAMLHDGRIQDAKTIMALLWHRAFPPVAETPASR